MAFFEIGSVRALVHKHILEKAAPCADCGKAPALIEDPMYDEISLLCRNHHGVKTQLRQNVGTDHSKAFVRLEGLLRSLVDVWNDNMKEKQRVAK
jgi:hypothetical protein